MKNEQTGETSQGNWVSAVSGGSAAPKVAAAPAKTSMQDVEETEAVLGGDTPVEDDDLGFG